MNIVELQKNSEFQTGQLTRTVIRIGKEIEEIKRKMKRNFWQRFRGTYPTLQWKSELRNLNNSMHSLLNDANQTKEDIDNLCRNEIISSALLQNDLNNSLKQITKTIEFYSSIQWQELGQQSSCEKIHQALTTLYAHIQLIHGTLGTLHEKTEHYGR